MSIVNLLSNLLDKILGSYYSEKVKMAANVLFHEWHMGSPLTEERSILEIANITDKELEVFDALDDESKWQIKKFVHTVRDFFTFNRQSACLFFNYSKIHENAEQKQTAKEMKKRLLKTQNEYHSLPGIVLGEYESLVAHHGLAESPEFIKNYVNGGVFLDIGACYGDSSLVFLKHYNPQHVIAFEPSQKNQTVFKKIMELNHVDSTKYTLVSLGLDKECKTVQFSDSGTSSNSLQKTSHADQTIECKPLDEFCRENKIDKIRFIKADVEGMGLNVLLGAKETIQKERPVLSLSIYHNREELFGIYKELLSWNLNYTIKVYMMVFPLAPVELSLFAWPQEIA